MENFANLPAITDVSVVIPYYNSFATIERAVNSALAQTFPVHEIIIIDDGSSPEGVSRLRGLYSTNRAITLIFSEVNAGPATARNCGWNAASGQWVAFLDSDDAWHPRKLELQFQAIFQAPEKVSISNTNTDMLEGSDFPQEFSQENIPTTRISRKKMIISNYIATSTVVVKSDVPLRFSEGRKYAEDYELWVRIISDYGVALQVDFPLVKYFKAPFGASGLSSNMMSMSLGAQKSIWLLFRSGYFSAPVFILASSASSARSFLRFGRFFFTKFFSRKTSKAPSATV